jgi:hypothetical protein
VDDAIEKTGESRLNLKYGSSKESRVVRDGSVGSSNIRFVETRVTVLVTRVQVARFIFQLEVGKKI